MKRIKFFLFAAIGLAAIATIVAVGAFNRFLDAPVTVPDDGLSYEIRSGMAFATVSAELADLGIIDNPDWLRWYASFTGKAQEVRAGEYWVESGTTTRQLLEKFVSGEVRLYSFTIVEGWTFRELLEAVARSEILETTISYDDWPSLLESFGATAAHPEGLFLPETYSIARNTRDTELLRQAYDLMREALDSEWVNRSENLPIDDPYEALVLASIIEKETAKEDERAQIAGVFVRRLEKNMRLQTDPTVIYGIGPGFDGNLTRTDLRTDTPYNTYTRHGLPPTPIALPGKAAINSALHPQQGSSLYFVATGLGDGGHEFSDTKDEHDAAVRRFLARQRAARNAQQGGQ